LIYIMSPKPLGKIITISINRGVNTLADHLHNLTIAAGAFFSLMYILHKRNGKKNIQYGKQVLTQTETGGAQTTAAAGKTGPRNPTSSTENGHTSPQKTHQEV